MYINVFLNHASTIVKQLEYIHMASNPPLQPTSPLCELPSHLCLIGKYPHFRSYLRKEFQYNYCIKTSVHGSPITYIHQPDNHDDYKYDILKYNGIVPLLRYTNQGDVAS